MRPAGVVTRATPVAPAGRQCKDILPVTVAAQQPGALAPWRTEGTLVDQDDFGATLTTYALQSGHMPNVRGRWIFEDPRNMH